jgi:glycerol-3-phosphate acyltransferase PlsY
MLVASYLAGAFPTAELVARARGRDIHREGSGNPGATNTYRVAGPRAAAVVALVDVAKGALTTLAGQRLAVGGAGAGNQGAGKPGGLGPACGVAAVLGHCFPPTNPTEGGKGVATTGGMLLVLDPPLALLSAVAWAALARTTRRAGLASIVVAAALPVAALAFPRSRPERVALAAVSAVILIRHRDNLVRLRSGREPAVGG